MQTGLGIAGLPWLLVVMWLMGNIRRAVGVGGWLQVMEFLYPRHLNPGLCVCECVCVPVSV